MRVIGVDFTSHPSPRKPITAAHGRLAGTVLAVDAIERLESFDAFERLLRTPGPWIGGFDLPFGLPRELVEHLGWPREFAALTAAVAARSRAELRATFKAFCDARPAGSKFAHRACDRPAGSSPSMKWVNPPVAYMLHAGVPRLLAAGLHLPGLHEGDPQRVALEAYPGHAARKVTRASYKSDRPALQTAARQEARERILDALLLGRAGLAVHLHLAPTLELTIAENGNGDLLDAVICALQAAHAATLPGYGLPPDLDPLEGWIASVPAARAARAAT